MEPYFWGRWKKEFDKLVAGGMTATEADHLVQSRRDHEDHMRVVRKLEADNKALRKTIAQLCLYGTK